MSDMGITPEDREQLAKLKFAEFGIEFLNSDAGKNWFAEQVRAMQEAAKSQRRPTESAPQQQQQQQQEQPKGRRRSALEVALSQTFGWS